jgi:hypothetical protein
MKGKRWKGGREEMGGRKGGDGREWRGKREGGRGGGEGREGEGREVKERDGGEGGMEGEGKGPRFVETIARAGGQAQNTNSQSLQSEGLRPSAFGARRCR